MDVPPGRPLLRQLAFIQVIIIRVLMACVRPRLAHFSGSSKKPYSAALSVHQTTPVDALLASKPA